MAHQSLTSFVSLKRIKTEDFLRAPRLCSAHAREEGTVPSRAGGGPYREEVGVEVEEGHEHQHQQDPAPQLHVLLGRALAHGGHAREHALALRPGLRQEQQQAPAQGQVPEGQKRRAGRQGSAGATAPPDRARGTEPARGHGTTDVSSTYASHPQLKTRMCPCHQTMTGHQTHPEHSPGLRLPVDQLGPCE